MSAPRRVGWVVDVQNDFMRPNGRLYVHDLFDASDAGAVQAEEPIVQTVAWMRAHCDVTVFTGDWHAYGDREIDVVAPDPAKDTYAPHCMGLSPDPEERRGAELITAIHPGFAAIVLPRDATDSDAREAARRAVAERRPVFVQKREFSVFAGNDSADAFVDALTKALGGQPEFTICGVATDVCVRDAIEGLLDRGHRVRAVHDAMWGLGLRGPAETFDRWSMRGAALTTLAELDS